ncbi:unnamed protein product [Schistosoma margrebowiei]|uniref:Uncharacterized protein n=1 Tax=Schistosoma margrebowiei TaxID=48269 RepID=A0A183LBT1_9TREM|nr:unnamed protein product [Schistosoma margrebowiei]
MYLHLRVDVHSGTRIQYRSLQMPSRYPSSELNFTPLHKQVAIRTQ